MEIVFRKNINSASAAATSPTCSLFLCLSNMVQLFFFLFKLTVHKDCRNNIKWNIFPNYTTEGFFKFLSSCFMGVLKLRGASWTPGDTVWRKMRSFFLQNRTFFTAVFSANAEERRRAIRRRSGRSSSLQTERVCKAIAPCYEKWTRRGNTDPARADRGKDANIFTLSRVVGARHWWKDKLPKLTPPPPDTPCGKRFLCQHQGGTWDDTTASAVRRLVSDATLCKKTKCPKQTHDFIEQCQKK